MKRKLYQPGKDFRTIVMAKTELLLFKSPQNFQKDNDSGTQLVRAQSPPSCTSFSNKIKFWFFLFELISLKLKTVLLHVNKSSHKTFIN